ncbi:hypothetical protein F4775DRAFT_558375 [Biscogniauxia sp. FL1348]|nr:hypothetical protein F4775DRAFT_558375 [Biscogniauxia sp. FL1348]
MCWLSTRYIVLIVSGWPLTSGSVVYQRHLTIGFQVASSFFFFFFCCCYWCCCRSLRVKKTRKTHCKISGATSSLRISNNTRGSRKSSEL